MSNPRFAEMMTELQNQTNDDRSPFAFHASLGDDLAALDESIEQIWAEGAIDRMHRNNEIYADAEGWTPSRPDCRKPVAKPLERPGR
jgi:hypothetical protein